VPYIIVGGVAAIVHGSTRMTEDLDICAPLDHPHAVKIIRALADVNPCYRMRPDMPPMREDNPNLKGLKNLYLKTDIGQLDILGELPGVGPHSELKDHSRKVDFRGLSCKVVDLETLIVAKRFAGRERDKRDVNELELIRDLLRQQRKL